MYKGKEYNIFICYRGSISGQGGPAGSILYGALNEITGFEPFYANAVLDEGADSFKNASRQVLKETKVFILLLTPGFFDDCFDDNDMVKDEIQTALRDARMRFIPITLPGFDAKREFTKEVSDLFEGDFEDRIEHISQIAWNNLGKFEIKDKLIRTISHILDDYGKDNAVAQAVSDDRSSAKSIGAKDARLTIENGVLVKCAEDAKGELIIPNGVTSIGYSAFRNCTYLTSITIPDSVTSIGSDAFWYCHSLTSIAIPDSVTSIGWYAFNDCYSLTSVTIGNGVTSIGKHAFGYCDSLETLTVAPGNPKYHSAGNCIIETATKTLVVGCKSSVIPDDGSVTSIGDYAFRYCASLTSIVIPDCVTSIGRYAFFSCDSLTSIVIPDGVMSIAYGAFAGCVSLTSVTIPDSVTSIEGRAFYGCTSLTSVTIPNSVTSMVCTAFANCSSLEMLTVAPGNPKYHSAENCIIETATKTLVVGCKSSVIPDDGSVTSIGEHAFGYCDSLTSIVIPDSVTSIEGRAFSSCTSLTSITIPDSMTSIMDSAFYGCDSLTSVTFDGTVAEWNSVDKGSSWKYNCPFTEVVCSDGVVEV